MSDLQNSTSITCADEKLPYKVKFAYGLSGYSSFITWTIFSLYGLYFFTDTVGFSAAFASAIMSLGTLWDAVTDPLVGIMSDNIVSDKGRRRPLIIGIAIPFALISILLFTNFGFEESVAKIYYIAVILLYYLAQTVLDVSSSALGSEMTLDYDERTSLASHKNFFGMLVVIIVSPTLVLVNKVGWSMTVAMYMLIALACIFILWKTTEGYERFCNNEKIDFKIVGEMFLNKSLIIVVCIFALGVFGNTVSLSLQIYFFSYFVGLTDSLISTVLMVGGIGACLAVFVVNYLCKKTSKKTAWLITVGLHAASTILFMGFLIKPGNTVLVFVWILLVELGVAAIYQVPWSMIPDCVEVSQLVSNKRIEGLIFGAIAFVQKLSGALAILVVGVGLTSIGYIANEVQSESTLESLRLLFACGVGIPLVISVIVSLLYPLTKERHRQVITAINKMKNDGHVDLHQFKDLVRIK
ncbi:MFS transporter [Bacillota bacterium]